MGVSSYKDLLVWQRGILIAEQAYELTKNFPQAEVYGLTSQIRRSAVSIASNIAEGFGRSSTKNYIQFIRIARGSLYELETQLILAKKLDFIEDNGLFENLVLNIEEEGKMINSFIKKLQEIEAKALITNG